MIDELTCQALYCCENPLLLPLFESAVYPWEILPKIGPFLKEKIENGLSDFTEIAPGVWVGANVTIAPTATLNPPLLIGEGTEIRPGAFIRGNVFIGRNCVVGNSTELKNCILMDHVQVPHYNYVGDSILGNHSHLGAGSICSNLKADGSSVVIHGEADHETHLRKVGAFLGDGANVGCSCVLNPGTVLGQHTVVYPMVSFRGTAGPDKIVKSADQIVQRR